MYGDKENVVGSTHGANIGLGGLARVGSTLARIGGNDVAEVERPMSEVERQFSSLDSVVFALGEEIMGLEKRLSVVLTKYPQNQDKEDVAGEPTPSSDLAKGLFEKRKSLENTLERVRRIARDLSL